MCGIFKKRWLNGAQMALKLLFLATFGPSLGTKTAKMTTLDPNVVLNAPLMDLHWIFMDFGAQGGPT